MTTISANPHVSSAQFLGVSLTSVEGAEKTVPQLRSAADVVQLTGGTMTKSSDAPELREPHVAHKGGPAEEAGKSMSISSVISMLIGMLNELMLQDSKRVDSSSSREVQLAASGANAQRKAGQAELNGGLAQAGAMFVGTTIGTARSVHGTSMQLKSTKTNVPMAAEYTNSAKAGGTSTAVADFTKSAQDTTNMHSQIMLKGNRANVQGEAVRSTGGALSKVAEANQGAEVSGHRAEQTVAGGDASVAARTTEMELKARSMTENLVDQMRAIRDRDIQSKNDAMSHVAQGSR